MEEGRPRAFCFSRKPYFHGSRLLYFTESRDILSPSAFNRFEQSVEQYLGSRIDSWPLPPVSYECPAGFTRISRGWSTLKLQVDVPTSIADTYSSEASMPVSMPSSPVSSGSAILDSQDPSKYLTDEGVGKLYWCVNTSFETIPETSFCIEDCRTIENDRDLCIRLERDTTR